VDDYAATEKKEKKKQKPVVQNPEQQKQKTPKAKDQGGDQGAPAANGKKEKKAKGDGKPAEAKPPKVAPEYIQHRVQMWEAIAARNKAAKANAPQEKIVITLPDGKTVEGIAGVTTPLNIAEGISKGLADRVCVAKVNGAVVDAWRPLESNCTLELCDFESK